MKISLLIIVKNGEKGIEQTIQSAKGIVNEIVVVDSGSTDKTLEIVKKYTKKVYEKIFENDFSKLRNFGLSKASGDWILVLDADEVLEVDTLKKVSELINQSQADGYWFRRKWYYDDSHYLKHGLFYPDYQLRLFRNTKAIRYQNRVHEELNIPKEKTKKADMCIDHYGSLSKYLSLDGFKKLNPYIQLLSLNLKHRHYSRWYLFWRMKYTFFDMFFVGLTRGKGLFDGWIGVKAHFFFALSVSLGYWHALIS